MKYLKRFNEDKLYEKQTIIELEGKIIIKNKSAYLLDKDNKEYILHKYNNDKYFEPYENKMVKITGDYDSRIDDKLINVSYIKTIPSSILSDVRREVDNSVSNLRSGLDKELYKYCYNCGEKLEKRAAFCNECGKKQD